ncbi:MAG: DNA-binding transcriptional regulator [Thermoguttaceae bacterium]
MPPKNPATHAPERRRIALLIESSLGSGREMLRGFAEYVRQTSHWSIYYEPSHSHSQSVLPEWLDNWHGDGIIARVRNRNVAKKLIKMGIPVVDVLGNVHDTGIPVVGVDNRAIARAAAGHLLEHGFRAFAYCGVLGPSWSQTRRDVFKETVTRSGYTSYHYLLPRLGGKAWISETERERLTQWIASLPKPIGIMAANDWAGQKVLEACRRAVAMVPEEVAVVGVDNDAAFCEICDPMLSSVVARHDRVGFYAAELLDQLMQGKPAPTEPLTVGQPSVVVRRSTDVQTIADRDIAEAVRYIREHAYGEISVEDVAAHVALSYSTLKRRFQQVLSRTIHDEIKRVRMARTRELLTETSMTLAQIAQLTGLRHQEYLGVVFKAEMGVTPSQFREENQSPHVG